MGFRDRDWSVPCTDVASAKPDYYHLTGFHHGIYICYSIPVSKGGEKDIVYDREKQRWLWRNRVYLGSRIDSSHCWINQSNQELDNLIGWVTTRKRSKLFRMSFNALPFPTYHTGESCQWKAQGILRCIKEWQKCSGKAMCLHLIYSMYWIFVDSLGDDLRSDRISLLCWGWFWFPMSSNNWLFLSSNQRSLPWKQDLSSHL